MLGYITASINAVHVAMFAALCVPSLWTSGRRQSWRRWRWAATGRHRCSWMDRTTMMTACPSSRSTTARPLPSTGTRYSTLHYTYKPADLAAIAIRELSYRYEPANLAAIAIRELSYRYEPANLAAIAIRELSYIDTNLPTLQQLLSGINVSCIFHCQFDFLCHPNLTMVTQKCYRQYIDRSLVCSWKPVKMWWPVYLLGCCSKEFGLSW